MRTYSAPLRRPDKRGAQTAVVSGKRIRCYRGWSLRWYDRATKQRGWEYAGESIDDARARKRELEVREARGEGHVEEVSFEQAADEFLAWKRGELAPGSAAPSSDQGWSGEPSRHLEELHRKLEGLKDAFHGRKLSEITGRDLERYFSGRDVAARTRNIERTILRGLFRWGRRHRYAAGDPTEDLPKWREPRHEARTISREEEAALLDACRQEYRIQGITGKRNARSRQGGATKKAGESWSQTFTPPPWLYPLVLLALRTALRLGSLLRLEWRHVNLERKTIHIPAVETKNQAELSIPMHRGVEQVLSSLRAQVSQKSKLLSLRVIDAVAPRPPLRRTVARVFTGAVRRAKLNPPITFHGLRKIAATRMLQGGVDLKTVMAIGGWTDPATLLRLYAAATPEAKIAAVAKL